MMTLLVRKLWRVHGHEAIALDHGVWMRAADLQLGRLVLLHRMRPEVAATAHPEWPMHMDISPHHFCRCTAHAAATAHPNWCTDEHLTASLLQMQRTCCGYSQSQMAPAYGHLTTSFLQMQCTCCTMQITLGERHILRPIF